MPTTVRVTVTVHQPPANPALLQAGDLVYQGAFRLPHGQIGISSFDYGGAGLAFSPERGSLFIGGHDQQPFAVAEIGIPALGRGVAVTDLATAPVLQPFADAFAGRITDVTTPGHSVLLGGLLPYQGRLYLTAYEYYGSAQTRSHFVSSLTIGREVVGPLTVASPGARYIAGYFGLIPQAWQDRLGGPVLNGQCCLSVLSSTSYGPAVFAVDPTQLGKTDPLPSVPLVYYPQAHPLEAYGASGIHPLFNGTTQMGGVVFPVGTRSVLFFGKQGLGRTDYGEATGDQSLDGKPTPDGVGHYVYDPVSVGRKGDRAFPYAYYVWAYDALDLAAVKRGEKMPWDVKPYATWSLDLPFANGNGLLRGATYDPASGRIFVSQSYGDGAYPVIHVYTVRKS